MRLLIIGDSMVRYLQKCLVQRLSIHDVHFECLPGATIERLTRKISLFGNHYDWILVHVGTNNTNSDSVEAMLRKYDCLFKEIFRLNPDIKVIVSAVISVHWQSGRAELVELQNQRY